MQVREYVGLVGILIAGCFSSCSRVETVPQVVIRPNPSGIEVGSIRHLGPSYSMGPTYHLDGTPVQPDIPTRTSLELTRVEAFYHTGDRYFIPASGRLDVLSVERYSTYREASSLVGWRRMLKTSHVLGESDKEALEDQLAEIPWVNAGRCFHGKLQKRKFPWGEAVLFLTSYVQGPTGGPVNNDALILVVQGLTRDGRYAVNGHFEIRHSGLPDSSWDRRRKGKHVFDIDDESEEAEKWLDSQTGESFSPTFKQYEAFLSALDISVGTSVKVRAKKS